MAIEAIVTDKAPAALGPYSAAVAATGTRAIHVSGQLPIDPATGEFAGEDTRPRRARASPTSRTSSRPPAPPWPTSPRSPSFSTTSMTSRP